VNRRLGVLISGRGSNLQALIDAVRTGRLDATIAVVLANRPSAQGLELARQAALETVVLDHREWELRDTYDAALAAALQQRDVGLVCLAGFMRLIGPPMLDAFPNAILNIHPSLLPAFPGLDAQRQAVEYGVKVSGVSVHFVTDELDGGPVVLQRAVPVHDDDTDETLSVRILEQEHLVYPAAVEQVLAGGWRVEGRRFITTA
jgi:phosphoribosylglycinamide formyltransferase-1